MKVARKTIKMTPIEFFRRFGIVVVLVALMTLFTILKPTFLNIGNLLEIMRQVSFSGIIAVGMSFCMLTGGIDLSVGSNMAFGLAIAALFMAAKPIPIEALNGFNINPIVGSFVGIFSSTAMGVSNGFFVNEIKIPPLIVTLATMEIIRGVVYVMTGAMAVYDGIEDYFRFIGQGDIFGIPFPVIILLLVFSIAGIVLNKTSFGRFVYCVGGNQEVARLSGINVKKVKYIVYALSGFLTGVAGILMLSYMNSCQPRVGIGYEFEVITACVLGGVSMSGGEGRLSGAFFGILIMGVLFNGLIQVGLSEFYQMIIKGVVLLIAVGIDAMSQNKKMKLSEMKNLVEEERKQNTKKQNN